MFRDCSHPIESGMPVYPGDPDVSLTPAATHETDGYSVQELHCGSHTGTHVDAPRHTEPDGETIDERDVNEWVFEARLVDVAPRDPRDPIGPEQFPSDLVQGGEGDAGDAAVDDANAAEVDTNDTNDTNDTSDTSDAYHATDAHHAIDANHVTDANDVKDDIDLLVVRTGWDDHWGEQRYRNHPYLTKAFAECCREAGVGVGLDTFSPDPTPPTAPTESAPAEPVGVPAHHVLLGAGLPIVENLRNLADLPETFTLYALPLPIGAGDGAPVRAVAEW